MTDIGCLPVATVRSLGEIVLRVRDMPSMVTFYSETLGLSVLRRFEDQVAFLRIGDGFEGHTQVLALFGAALPPNADRRPWLEPDQNVTPLHHFAFAISLTDHQFALERLSSAGLKIKTATHTWIGWRAIYFLDPEGNTVELVCYDPSIDRRAEYNFDKLYGDPSISKTGMGES